MKIHCDRCSAIYGLTEYRRLSLVGLQSFTQEPAKLELRKCACGARVKIWLNRAGEPITPDRLAG